MSWIQAGAAVDPNLPVEHLTPEELAEVRRLLQARAELLDQQRVVENHIQLLLLNARDKRGLTNPVRANPETGELVSATDTGLSLKKGGE